MNTRSNQSINIFHLLRSLCHHLCSFMCEDNSLALPLYLSLSNILIWTISSWVTNGSSSLKRVWRVNRFISHLINIPHKTYLPHRKHKARSAIIIYEHHRLNANKHRNSNQKAQRMQAYSPVWKPHITFLEAFDCVCIQCVRWFVGGGGGGNVCVMFCVCLRQIIYAHAHTLYDGG